MTDNIFNEMLAGWLASRRGASKSTCPWKGDTTATKDLRKWWLAGYDCTEASQFTASLNQLRGPSRYQTLKEKWFGQGH